MALSDIDHVFVLMLENRSYDHLLGSLALRGKTPAGQDTAAIGLPAGASNSDRAGNPVPSNNNAPFSMPVDPSHEFDDVRLQLLGANGPTDTYLNSDIQNSGFVLSYQAVCGANPTGGIMSSFPPARVPCLVQLATTFCLCDQWFSSLPGPTVPNRYFLLAGSCNGDPKSPNNFSLVRGELGDPVKFANGTIFTRIKQQADLSFVVYCGDDLPLALTVDGVDRGDTRLFSRDQFAQDCNSPTLPDFIFIEPAYDFLASYRNGNSQHPLGDIRAGEQLIKDVYDGIRGSANWTRSVLIVTYDEHGGFYDHVKPPGEVPAPGDVPNKYNFDFTQLGVRVPAVIVSPLILPTIDHTVYDHTSVLATLRARFPQIGWLTERDRLANDLGHLFTSTLR